MEGNATPSFAPTAVEGVTAVKAAVAVFYNRVLADSDLAPWFEGVDLERLKGHQRAFLTMALAGPDAFLGRDLRTAHAGMAITHAAFDSTLAHLTTALLDVGMDDTVVTTLIGRLQYLRPQIVAG